MIPLALLAALCGPSAPAPAAKPNVLVILVDDLGFNDVGFNGCKDIPTPHLDALAKSGVRCEAGYVTHPYCSPTRAGLLAGRYQQRFGHENNPEAPRPEAGEGLPIGETLLPAALKPAGYVSGAVGKWHIGEATQFQPLNRGFDEFYGFLRGGHSYFGKSPKGSSLMRGAEPADASGVTYLTDTLTDEAVSFVRRHKSSPWFLYLAYNAVHAPDQATPNYLGRFPNLSGGRKTYAAMTSAMDDGVGRVTAALREAGIDRNTLIVFLSDNGGRLPMADNAPFRGHKGRTHEGGVRVPFAVSWPARIPAGGSYPHPVSSLDIYATALAAAGVPAPRAEGIDLAPYLSGARPEAPDRALYWRVSGGWDYAIRDGNWKLCKPGWKDEPELYDLAADPGESRDLAAERTAELFRLRKRYEEWDAANVPPLWPDSHRGNVAKERAAEARK